MMTWFSHGQPSYNTMVDIDTNMFNCFNFVHNSWDIDLSKYKNLNKYNKDPKRE